MKQKKVPAVERTLNILELLGESEEPLSFTQIGRQLQISKPSLSRLLSNLKERDYLHRNTTTKRYELGLRLLHLGSSLLEKIDLRGRAQPFLQELMEKSGETVELGILDGDALLFIDKWESSKSIRLFAKVGSRFPKLHASAPGKVLLAYIPEEDFKRFIRKGLVRVTNHTITKIKKLREELKKIKKLGYGFDDQEVREGVRRFASPIFDHQGNLAGVVGIAGPAFRMLLKKKRVFGKMVKETAEKISRRLGYRKPQMDADKRRLL